MDGVKGSGSVESAAGWQQFRYMLQAIQDVRSGKVAREDAAETTTLRYRLDPGERGVLSSATPEASQRAVTNQEQTNVRRLSAEARARGEDVVAVDVDYETQIVDGKLAIVAGHTEVTSREAEGGRQAQGGGEGGRAEYGRIGAANRDAAASIRYLDLQDDATMRGLSGGLEPGGEDQG